ncbi:aminotransferase class I/II-fold pyridoxal phosphate-dependent enzyme [Pedobacter sp. MW01-1-1]|uniref:aminotransferase class I/II-fold pyridoxal phosphate-dependent enzyme n=1 Tax=Pedobacter sp. MW01-1-1 TaxID=3383027 RepID=UPI003FEF0CBB
MLPNFSSIPQPFSNRIMHEGQSYLYFGGTAYLGIPRDADFLALYLEGLKKYGINNGTSRNNNVQLGIYNEVEQYAANYFKTPDALLVSSGYLAAQLCVKAFSKKAEVRYAPATHPALWLQDENPNNQSSFINWTNEIIQEINQSPQKSWVLISNSMNNLFPEIYSFDFVKEIHRTKEIILLVDDSHGIGINNNGLSAYSSLPQQKNIHCVVVAFMAKALGVDAGIVLASKKIIQELKNTNEFFGASPASAAGLYAFSKAENIYANARVKLQGNMRFFESNLDSEWAYVSKFPAYLSTDPLLDQKLFPHNILLSSFAYPTKDSPSINRIVLSSWHTETDIKNLLHSLNR